jgi:uncharacterized membrane protein YgcG
MLTANHPMRGIEMNGLTRVIVAWACAAVMLTPLVRAQDTAQTASFKKEEIEQLVAPIALYPDALVAQILMASTYPLEIVSAARWSKANPNVKDKALEDAMQKQTWDPSVKSLTAFPSVLAMMNDKLDMTQKLGDAFLGQQKEVMDAVQRLRAQALKAGNLKSSKEQKVTTEQQGTATIIKIEPADPQVVYVPVYNPTVVYGPWPYPAYPPYYYYPPGYSAGSVFFAFTVGVVVGNAMWGGCHWGGGNVYINHNTYNNFNKTDIKIGDWQHKPEHRKGVEYRDAGSRQKYSGQRPGVDTREAYRGRADAGRQDIARGDADSFKRDGGVGDRAGGAGDRSGGVGDRGAGVGDRSAGAADRGGSRQADGFDGIGSGGQTRAQSDRGASSRASASSSARAGGGRAGGGGGRGGGRR